MAASDAIDKYDVCAADIFPSDCILWKGKDSGKEKAESIEIGSQISCLHYPKAASLQHKLSPTKILFVQS